MLSFSSIFNIDISSSNFNSPIVFNYISNYKFKKKKKKKTLQIVFIIISIITIIFKSYYVNYSYLIVTIATTQGEIIKSFGKLRHLFTIYDGVVAFKYTQLDKILQPRRLNFRIYQPVRSFLKWPYIFGNLLRKRKSCQTRS